MSFYAQSVPRDGNCFFHALSWILAHHPQCQDPQIWTVEKLREIQKQVVMDPTNDLGVELIYYYLMHEGDDDYQYPKIIPDEAMYQFQMETLFCNSVGVRNKPKEWIKQEFKLEWRKSLGEQLIESWVWATSVTILIMERFFKIKIGIIRENNQTTFHKSPNTGETFILLELIKAHYKPLYQKKGLKKIVFFNYKC